MNAAAARQSLNENDFADVIPWKYQRSIPHEIAQVIRREVRRERHRLLFLLELSHLIIDPVTVTAVARGWTIPKYIVARNARLLDHLSDASRRLLAPAGHVPGDATAADMIAALRGHLTTARIPQLYMSGGPLYRVPTEWTAAQLTEYLEAQLTLTRNRLAERDQEEADRKALWATRLSAPSRTDV